MHNYGFVDNDVGKNNILINSNGSVFFIDFTFQALGSRLDFRREAKLLAGLIKSDVSGDSTGEKMYAPYNGVTNTPCILV